VPTAPLRGEPLQLPAFKHRREVIAVNRQPERKIRQIVPAHLKCFIVAVVACSVKTRGLCVLLGLCVRLEDLQTVLVREFDAAPQHGVLHNDVRIVCFIPFGDCVEPVVGVERRILRVDFLVHHPCNLGASGAPAGWTTFEDEHPHVCIRHRAMHHSVSLWVLFFCYVSWSVTFRAFVLFRPFVFVPTFRHKFFFVMSLGL
jgi:hypothetical protein